jgi:hypothetical protein
MVAMCGAFDDGMDLDADDDTDDEITTRMFNMTTSPDDKHSRHTAYCTRSF